MTDTDPDAELERPPRHSGPPGHARGGGIGAVTALRGTGEVLITLGVIVLLFVFYEVYVTDWFSANEQRSATAQLDQRWHNDRGNGFGPIEGQAFAKLYIPALGPDYHFSVVQGTSQKSLAIGPGHYTHTAMPGQLGNFAVAGHRVGRGAPFNDLDLVRSCDAMVVETVDHWYVYRMLPEANEVAGWSQGRGRTPLCARSHVAPLGGAYQGVVGQEVVDPSQSQVINPVPDKPAGTKPGAALITLTTCHPKFSAKQRLILHGVLVKTYAKHGNATPPELSETT